MLLDILPRSRSHEAFQNIRERRLFGSSTLNSPHYKVNPPVRMFFINYG